MSCPYCGHVAEPSCDDVRYGSGQILGLCSACGEVSAIGDNGAPTRLNNARRQELRTCNCEFCEQVRAWQADVRLRAAREEFESRVIEVASECRIGRGSQAVDSQRPAVGGQLSATQERPVETWDELRPRFAASLGFLLDMRKALDWETIREVMSSRRFPCPNGVILAVTREQHDVVVLHVSASADAVLMRDRTAFQAAVREAFQRLSMTGVDPWQHFRAWTVVPPSPAPKAENLVPHFFIPDHLVRGGTCSDGDERRKAS